MHWSFLRQTDLMTKRIALTRGMFALVDDEDFARLSAFKWRAVEGRCGCFYASRSIPTLRNGRKGQSSREMQRDVLDPDFKVSGRTKADHRNGDTLDNQRGNLRWATNVVNRLNSRIHGRNGSGYRGVHFVPKRGLYRAQLAIEGRRLCGGYHATAEAAAAAYNALALAHHGPEARLNPIPTTQTKGG